MNSNDLLKNFPTKSWGKVFLQKNKKLRIGYLPFQKGFATNLCLPRPSSSPCIAFVYGFGLASKTIVITVFLKPIYALSS